MPMSLSNESVIKVCHFNTAGFADDLYGDFMEPIIGWLVVFPEADSLAELVFRDETRARRAAADIPGAVVSNFSTPDAGWHRWAD